MERQPIKPIDLNADLGEHDGTGFAEDEALLDVVSSASIACGGHAGNPDVIMRTVRAATERSVSVGAHPSYPDRDGFGRRSLDITLDALVSSVEDQIRLVARSCARENTVLKFVKLHGALYNVAADDRSVASAMAACIAGIDASLAVLALPRSEMETAARNAGLAVAREGFIDRAYTPAGRLVPRDVAGAVIADVAAASARALRMALDSIVTAIDGAEIVVAADSLCVHSDSANALELLRTTRQALERAGVTVRAFA